MSSIEQQAKGKKEGDISRKNTNGIIAMQSIFPAAICQQSRIIY